MDIQSKCVEYISDDKYYFSIEKIMRRKGNRVLETQDELNQMKNKITKKCKRKRKGISEEFFPTPDFNAESTVETSGMHCGPRIQEPYKKIVVEEPAGFDFVAPEKYYPSARRPSALCQCEPYFDKRRKEKEGRIIKQRYDSYRSRILAYKKDVIDPRSEPFKNTNLSKIPSVNVEKRHRSAWHDVFDLRNVVFTSVVKELKVSRGINVIKVPEFSVLDKSFYARAKSEGFNTMEEKEDDSDGFYEKMHKPHEISEELNKGPGD